MAARKDEAIASNPLWICWIMYEVALEERVGSWR
jgi:hypothetical protein